MTTPRSTFAGNDIDQVNDEAPAKKSAMTTEVHSSEGGLSSSDERKVAYDDGSTSESEHSEIHYSKPVENAMDLVTEVLHVDDDTSLDPWTFRMWFLGLGLSAFGGVLSTIYYFKPQTVFVSTIFLAVISYVLGEAMAFVIPRKGWLGKLFNPHPFNHKEHAAIIIMSSAAANAALGIEVLAVQRLYYGENPNAATSIFLLFSSQCLGYGIAGLMRETLIYPTRMLYPVNLPINTLLETLHRDKKQTGKRLKVFYISFAALFVYEVFPEYIMPLLTGFSIICLAKRDNLVVTNLFGGSDGNEGLGLLSFGLDWNYISGSASPLWYPLQTLCNNLVGYFLCIFVFMGLYYNNVWDAKKFPFLSQLLYSAESNGTNYIPFNQTAILDANNRVDPKLVAEQGLPFYTATYAVSQLTSNMAITATFVHMLLWCYGDISPGWAFMNRKDIKTVLRPSTWNWRFWHTDEEDKQKKLSDPETDPHYRLMLAYKDAPDWWYAMVLLASLIIGLVCLYTAKSTLPWWALLVALAISWVSMVFFSAMYAITGFGFNISNIAQLIGAYMNPGLPVANMYFTLYGYNSINQGQLLLKDLKIAQYAKLPPRCTFVVQMVGTLLGSIFNYVMMDSITKNQRDILLSIEGTNVWSGQMVQSYNTNAIAWGGLAKSLFSAGGRFQWLAWAFIIGFFVPLPTYILHRLFPRMGWNYWNLAIISWYIGWLCVGINSSVLPFFVVGFFSQFYLRKYRADWFIKYNYILSAGLDGGTQVIVFILSFAVLGASGKSRMFPDYWGNNFQSTGTNYDYCMRNPAN